MERLKELIEKEELTLEEALLGKLPAGSEYGTLDLETTPIRLHLGRPSQEERSGKRKRERTRLYLWFGGLLVW
ncbi:hypothetical protein HC235_06910 [Pyrobaculum arsenaticum]|uniref:Uncharacterized protein n=1 Tax=Pyrobaculum arsenaticum TaxID=121277 RepID=A0A7L4P9P0_9CREN|nr:hypothetical protein [Pyrobaculum arsenaticum]